MSEANNTWRVDVDGVEHEVRLDHTQMMKHTVTVDGDTVVDFGDGDSSASRSSSRSTATQRS